MPAPLRKEMQNLRTLRNANVEQLLLKLIGAEKAAALFNTLNHPQVLNEWEPGVSRRR
jgi:hypothetical protein